MVRLTVADLNTWPVDGIVGRLGHLFEHAPWVVERALVARPFETLAEFHAACVDTVAVASREAQVALIREHPDLVGHAAPAGSLTASSTAEQQAAGLDADALTHAERDAFRINNAAYRDRFGFPFVICARENRKDAILAGFAARLVNGRDEEIATALREIGKIAWYRLLDVVVSDEARPGGHTGAGAP